MKVTIVHDSERGNGKELAEKLAAAFESKGARAVAEHRSTLTPETVAADPPDLLIVGAAVRRFFLSPPVKRWISGLADELDQRDGKVAHAAIFLTHAMPDAMVEGRVQRLLAKLSRVDGIGEVSAEWLSAQVKDIPGPFIDGVFEKAEEFAENLRVKVGGGS